ncbi:MAG: hypothetical protein ACXVRZ_16390 [Gaiellaceae bacterium]
MIVLITWAFWRLRKGPQPRSPVQGRIAFALMIGPPIALAFSMPGFDMALVAWLGFPNRDGADANVRAAVGASRRAADRQAALESVRNTRT